MYWGRTSSRNEDHLDRVSEVDRVDRDVPARSCRNNDQDFLCRGRCPAACRRRWRISPSNSLLALEGQCWAREDAVGDDQSGVAPGLLLPAFYALESSPSRPNRSESGSSGPAAAPRCRTGEVCMVERCPA